MRNAGCGFRDIAAIRTMQTFDTVDENVELSAEQIESGT
jgi:hypothetical protein